MSFLGIKLPTFGTPDTPKVTAAKADVEEAEKAAAESVAAAKAKLEEAKKAPEASDSGMASQVGQGRRKRKGGKHTKKHRKVSKRGRTGRKSSRL